MRFWIVFVTALFLCISAGHAEPIAGNSCAEFPANAVMQSSGAAPNTGTNLILTCVSNVWTATQPNPTTIPAGTEPAPGDSCSTYPENAVMRSGGPERGGALLILSCNAGQWRLPGTAVPQDNTPDAFAFTIINDAMLDEEVLSNIVTITGIGPDPVPVRITNPTVDWAPMFRIDGGDWTQDGTISNGQTLQLSVWTTATAAAPPALFLNPATVAVGKTAATPPADFIRTWIVRVLREKPAGEVMPDGTVYAGISPDGDVPMYTTVQDATDGFRPGNATPDIYAWSTNGSYNGLPALNCTSINDTTSTGCKTGESNTTTLEQIGNKHQAAYYCAVLSSYGYSDWYLPSQQELKVLYTNRVAIKNFQSANYWSSSENASQGNAWSQSFTNGQQLPMNTQTQSRVRCVRTDFRLIFTDLTGRAWNVIAESDIQTISGLTGGPASMTVSGTGNPQIRINGGAWVSSATFANGNTLQLRMTTADAANATQIASIALTVPGPGGDTNSTKSWKVTTGPYRYLPGYIMPDGTIYAGISPDGNLPMFVPDRNAQETNAGFWGNNGVLQNVRNAITGAANTVALTAASPSAAACANSTSNGRDDWYWPAKNELNVIYQNIGSLPAANFLGQYMWSSTENDAATAWIQNFANGVQSTTNKGFNGLRCARKGE